MRIFLFSISLLLLSFNLFSQVKVKNNYTAPNFVGSVKVQDTLGVVNILLTDTVGSINGVIEFKDDLVLDSTLGIGVSIPDASSIFEIVSIIKGAVNAPLMTEAQRDAIGTPPEGLKIWNIDTKKNNSFNGTIWEGAAFQPQNVVYVTQESDLPTPSGGIITLADNTVYVFYNDDPTNQKIINIANEIKFPNTGGSKITSVGLSTIFLNYTGTGTLFTTSEIFTGFITIENLFFSAPSGTLFDIDGVLPVGDEFFPRLHIITTGVFNTSTIGSIKNISFNMNISAFFDCKQGIIFDHCEEVLISSVRFTDWKNEANSVFVTLKNSLRFPKINNCVFETKPNETLFDFQPSIPAGDIAEVSNCIFRGVGTDFTTGITDPIASIADASSSGNVISTVTGTPFDEVIFTDVVHGLSKGQIITTSTFADANYNGTFEVLEIVHPDSFRVHTLFTATGTGVWATDLIQITDAAHGLSNQTGVQITGTTDNNGGGLTFNVAANTFEINGIFVSTSTGDWNTNSLAQKDTRIFFNGNSGLINSQSIAIGTANANATLTSVTDGAYLPITLTGLVADVSVTERFTLTTAANGIWTYIDSKPLSGIVQAAISGIKTGATSNYRFTVSINGATPVFASAVYIPMEVRTTKVQVTLTLPASLIQGDTVQIMQAGDGTGDDITITDMSMIIR